MKMTEGGGVEFTIPGEPVAKARPRVTSQGTYTPAHVRKYEQSVHLLAANARARLGITTPRKANAWRVTIHLYRYSRKAADADNMVKAILDGMNGTLYADDSQVEAGGWATYWVDDPTAACAKVYATPLPRPPRPPKERT